MMPGTTSPAPPNQETNMNNHHSPEPPSPSASQSCWPQKDVTLPGRYISLTPLESQHADFIWPIVSSPEVTHAAFWSYMRTDPWPRYEDLQRVISSRMACQDGAFYAMVNAQGRPQGWIGLRHVDLRNGKGDLGIFLPDPLVQRTAVATEAVYLLLLYAFESLGFACVGWMTDVINEPSRRAAERMGFVVDVDAVVDGSEVGVDPIYYTMLAGEWMGVKKAMETWLHPGNFDGKGVQKRRLGDIRRAITTEMYLGSAANMAKTLC